MSEEILFSSSAFGGRSDKCDGCGVAWSEMSGEIEITSVNEMRPGEKGMVHFDLCGPCNKKYNEGRLKPVGRIVNRPGQQ